MPEGTTSGIFHIGANVISGCYGRSIPGVPHEVQYKKYMAQTVKDSAKVFLHVGIRYLGHNI